MGAGGVSASPAMWSRRWRRTRRLREGWRRHGGLGLSVWGGFLILGAGEAPFQASLLPASSALALRRRMPGSGARAGVSGRSMARRR